MGKRFLIACLAAAAVSVGKGGAPRDPETEPRIFLMGVWPDRLRLFDEEAEEFIGDFRLRHGAVGATGHTPDYRRYFFVTDRMESVEVVDVARRAVVDELKLSTEQRKVRFNGVVPDPTGRYLYLTGGTVRMEVDRFVPEEPEIIIYDLEERRIKDTFKLPEEIRHSWRVNLVVSPDGKSLFVLGQDIYELSTSTHEIVDKIVLSKPLLAGYGPFRGLGLREAESGIYYGIYRTVDPFLKKTMIGVARLDLLGKEVENFELGPDLKVGLFALSPDGKRGYAGLKDLIVIDMEAQRILKRKEGFEKGRTNTSFIVSADGKKLYISGVGDSIYVYDATTLERLKTIFAGGDFMSPATAVPRSVFQKAAVHR